MTLSADEFKRYRSGNCWVTAAILDEDETVTLLGEGSVTVSAGMVLIVTPYGDRFECHSSYTFFDLLGFEEVAVKEVVNVPDNVEHNETETTDMVGGGTVSNDGVNDEVSSESENHVTNVVVADSMGTGTVSSNEGNHGGDDD